MLRDLALRLLAFTIRGRRSIAALVVPRAVAGTQRWSIIKVLGHRRRRRGGLAQDRRFYAFATAIVAGTALAGILIDRAVIAAGSRAGAAMASCG